MKTKFKEFLFESSLEKTVAKIIKKQGYAMFDKQGEQVAITDIEGGYGYGLSNLDNDVEVNLNGKSDWVLSEGTGTGDIASTGAGFDSDGKHKIQKKYKNAMELSEVMKGGIRSDLESALHTIQTNCYSKEMEDAINEVLDLMDTLC